MADCVVPTRLRLTNGSWALVTPGVVDHEALTAYTQGHCMALALVLAEQPGWSIVLAIHGTPEDFEEYEDCGYSAEEVDELVSQALHEDQAFALRELTHVLAVSPAGDLVDIGGRVSVAEYLDRYNLPYHPARLVPIEAAALMAWMLASPPQLCTQNLALARTFVAPVSARAGACLAS